MMVSILLNQLMNWWWIDKLINWWTDELMNRGRRYGIFKKMNIFIEWIIRFFWMNIFWINNQFYFWMNILLNEYFRFDFELNIELNHFLARFNVWMNNQNKLNSASGVQRGEVSEGDFSPCFWESFPYSLSYSTLFTGFHSTFWNNIILNCF